MPDSRYGLLLLPASPIGTVTWIGITFGFSTVANEKPWTSSNSCVDYPLHSIWVACTSQFLLDAFLLEPLWAIFLHIMLENWVKSAKYKI